MAAVAGSSATLPPADVRKLFSLIDARRYAELEVCADELSRRYPDAGLPWKSLGLALWMQGKEAHPALLRAAELLPQDAEAHSNLGNALRARGRLDEALASHRRAVALTPAYAAAHNNLGSTLRDLNLLEEARVSYVRAIELDSSLAMAHANLGGVLLRLDRLADAALSYERAVKLRPDFFDAQHSLATVRLRLRHFELAAASWRQVLRIDPACADAHGNLGNALRELGRADDAVVSYRVALGLSPLHAELHNNLGNALLDVGRPEEALASYAKAIEIDPGFAKAYGNRGSALRELGRLEEAEASCRHALLLAPHIGELHQNLGAVFKLQGRVAAADECCRKALQLNPQSAAATAFLGELAAEMGRFEESEKLFRDAIAMDADLAPAWAGIPGVRKMTRDDADWVNEALRVAGLPQRPRDEAQLHFSIGKYFDDVRDFDRAFEHYRRANELARRGSPGHDRQRLTNTFDYIIQFYDEQWVKRQSGGANQSSRPVFIVGMPRSGTSLAEQILASHRSVFGAGELSFWKVASVTVAPLLDQPVQLERELTRLADEYLSLLESLSLEALRVVDKMPANFAHLGLIHSSLPNARFIHMKRNPADTCLSIYFQNFHGTHSYSNDLQDLCHFYREYRRLMNHWLHVLPEGTVLEVPYEGLVNDQETWSRKMLEFVGLPWDASCLDFHRTTRTVSTFSKWQVRQKMSQASVERWRNYAGHVPSLLELLSED